MYLFNPTYKKKVELKPSTARRRTILLCQGSCIAAPANRAFRRRSNYQGDIGFRCLCCDWGNITWLARSPNSGFSINCCLLCRRYHDDGSVIGGRSTCCCCVLDRKRAISIGYGDVLYIHCRQRLTPSSRECCAVSCIFSNSKLGCRCQNHTLAYTRTNCVILISRQSHSRQNTDNRHNDHQFDQGKTLLHIACDGTTVHTKLLIAKEAERFPVPSLYQQHLCQALTLAYQ